jgi:transcriptional regulator with XRE-family HTH domain
MANQGSMLIRLFAANLRRSREAAGLSQEALAERAGLDRTYVSGCERGVRNPSLRSVEKIARALSVSPNILLE